MAWLEPLLARASERDRPDLLVLCRTSATLRAFLRAIASGPRRAFQGLHVATLDSLLAEQAPKHLRCSPLAEDDGPAFPAAHPWAAALAERPRLREEVRARAEQVATAAVVGLPLDGFSPELRALAATPFARSERVELVERLLAHPPRAEVIALGFGEATADDFSFAGAYGAIERALLQRLGAKPHVGTGAPSVDVRLHEKLPTYLVPDVTAEARFIAQQLLYQPDALVLVPDDATAARVRGALARNGVAVADDAPIPLTSHALAPVLRALAPLFATRGEAALDHESLLRLMRSPVLQRGLPKPLDGERLDEPDDDTDDRPRLNRRDVHALLAQLRLNRAPLSAWIERVKAVEARLQEGDTNERRRTSARVLRERLERLKLRAEDGTLWALGDYVGSLGLLEPDPLGRAIVGALKARGDAAATQQALDDLLESSTSARAVHDGVTVLQYRDYDGRPAPVLVLAGVHDKGLGRVPNPDAFLRPNDLASLGLRGGREAQRELLAMARWAAQRAERVVAVSPTHDGSGRRVAFPVDLTDEKTFHRDHLASSYGRTLKDGDGKPALPELRDLRAFGARPEGAKDTHALAVQLEAEWARAGAHFTELGPIKAPAEVVDPKKVTLATLLDQQPARPERVLPLLGTFQAGPAEGAPRELALSASALSNFTQCLYKGFCSTTLGLRTRDDVSEEADSRDVGTMIHAALEAVLEGRFLIVPAADLERTREELRQKLEEQTTVKLHEFLKDIGVDRDEARGIAEAATAGKWAANWGAWLERRIGSLDDLQDARIQPVVKESVEWPERVKLQEAFVAADYPATKVDPALDKTIAHALRTGELSDALEYVSNAQAKTKVAKAAAFARTEAVQQLVPALRARVLAERPRVAVPAAGDAKVVHVELAFGDHTHRAEQFSVDPLSLGSVTLRPRGSIDAVIAHGDAAEGSYEIVDFKTGKKAGKKDEVLQTLTSPQLAYYALVLPLLAKNAATGLDERAVARLTYDLIRAKPTEVDVPEGALDAVRADLDALLGRALAGDHRLAPHPRGCPVEMRGSYCDFQEICRHRGLPETPSEDS